MPAAYRCCCDSGEPPPCYFPPRCCCRCAPCIAPPARSAYTVELASPNDLLDLLQLMMVVPPRLADPDTWVACLPRCGWWDPVRNEVYLPQLLLSLGYGCRAQTLTPEYVQSLQMKLL